MLQIEWETDLGDNRKKWINAVLTEPISKLKINLPKANVRRKKKKKPQHRLKSSIKHFYENRHTNTSIEKNKVPKSQNDACLVIFHFIEKDTLFWINWTMSCYNPLLSDGLSNVGSFVFTVPTSFLDHLIYEKEARE